MYYTIYKITNKINGKFYIGSHKTNDLNDSYMGSGKYLKHAIEKHGIDNFTKEILFIFDNPEEMYAKEAEIVNEDFLAEENTYNLKVGGFGGWDYNNTTEGQILRAHSYKKWLTAGTAGFLKKYFSDYEFRSINNEQLMANSIAGKITIKTKYPNGTFYGKTHSDDTKKKISLSVKEKSKGESNSQFGTMWITNGDINKKIKNSDPIPDGWRKGRLIKSS